MIPQHHLHRPLLRVSLQLGFFLALSASAAKAGALPDYRTISPAALSTHIEDVLAVPEAAQPEYWRAKPALAMPALPPAPTKPSPQDLRAVEHMKQGEFTSYPAFPWKPLGVPPPWDTNPFGNLTWDMYRHSLRWTEPLLRAYTGKSDVEALRLMQRVIADWIEKNSLPPGLSQFAWHDHPAGVRLRTICRFWEVWRKSELFDPEFARVLLASVYQHAAYLADPSVYPANFNHGQEMDAALMVAAITFPEFKDAQEWYRLAERRTLTYLSRNFSPEGAHLEQSPGYHWYVLQKAAAVCEYLSANGRPPAQAMADVIGRAASAMPYLVKPDGLYPLVGDSAGGPPAKWSNYLAKVLSRPIAPAPPPKPKPRNDGSSFFLSFPAGYAVFTSYPVGQPKPTSDIYALFKCNAFSYSHAHNDALSFVLYGLGRDWLTDSGKFNYEENTLGRRYVRSARAHNVVLVDNANIPFSPVRLVAWGRDDVRDFVTVTQQTRPASHTRSFQFYPPTTIWINDVLESADGKPHTYSQLFQVAPGLRVEQVNAGRLRLSAPNGDACLIDQLYPVGEWKVVTGEKEPHLQGWYSSDYNRLEPISTVFFTSAQPSGQCLFSTRIVLLKEGAAAPPPLGQGSPAAAKLVAFSKPYDQYVSRWRQRTKSVTVTPQDEGLRCDILGGGDRTATQYGGVGFGLPPFKALALDLSFPSPDKITNVYVDGYDEKGNRVLRWQWRMTSANRPPARPGKQRAVYMLEPGKAAGPFQPVGQAKPSALKAVEVFVAIAPGAKTGFILHRAEVTPAG